MRTVFKRTLVGFIAGLFSGTMVIGIIIFLIDILYGETFDSAHSNALGWAIFFGPIGAWVGLVIGAFISMTDYTSSVKYKWGIVAGLGATLGTAFTANISIVTVATFALITAITGEIVARYIAAFFAESVYESGALRSLLSYTSSSLVITIGINKYWELLDLMFAGL